MQPQSILTHTKLEALSLKSQFQYTIENFEWYDNSRLNIIQACKRKAYYTLMFSGGLGSTTGNGATFGTCVHYANEIYYNNWGRYSETDRRAMAIQAFVRKHRELFGEDPQVDTKHTENRGIAILTDYFQRFLAEDPFLRPIDNELRFIITIYPEPGDPDYFTMPFLYLGRCDGLWLRERDSSLWIRELKTTSQQASKELERLTVDRQPTSYFYSIGQFPLPDQTQLKGIICDVIQVAATKFEAARDYIYKTPKQILLWRAHTIRLVEHWREIRDRTDFASKWSVEKEYYQETNECYSKYGQCPFYQACRFGEEILSSKERNLWNPLTAA